MVAGLGRGCVPADLDASLVGTGFVLSVMGLEAAFAVAGLGLASPGIDRACALTVPVLLVEGSELVCAFAGIASVNAKKRVPLLDRADALDKLTGTCLECADPSPSPGSLPASAKGCTDVL